MMVFKGRMFLTEGCFKERRFLYGDWIIHEQYIYIVSQISIFLRSTEYSVIAIRCFFLLVSFLPSLIIDSRQASEKNEVCHVFYDILFGVL